MNPLINSVLVYNNSCDSAADGLVIGSFGHLGSNGLHRINTTGTLDYCLLLAQVRTRLQRGIHLITIVTRTGAYDDQREVLYLIKLLADGGNFVQLALTESVAEDSRLSRLLSSHAAEPWTQHVDIRPVQQLHGSPAHDWARQVTATPDNR
jgi:hypothetical protein